MAHRRHLEETLWRERALVPTQGLCMLYEMGICGGESSREEGSVKGCRPTSIRGAILMGMESHVRTRFGTSRESSGGWKGGDMLCEMDSQIGNRFGTTTKDQLKEKDHE